MITKLERRIASFILLFWAAALPALADSMSLSSISDSIATSVGSISNSIKNSSNSSSKTDRTAEGDYKVIEVAAVAERPGAVRMKLQALAEGGAGKDEFYLYLPQAAYEQAKLAPGRTVTARQRPYGVEFAGGEPRQAFFLALDDDWYRELQAKAVTL